jgi:hypothetical protein
MAPSGAHWHWLLVAPGRALRRRTGKCQLRVGRAPLRPGRQPRWQPEARSPLVLASSGPPHMPA